jgi:hypothetical protein
LEEPERFFLLLSEIVSSEITFALADKAAEKAAANAVEPWPKIGRVDNWRKIGIWIKEKLKGSAK